MDVSAQNIELSGNLFVSGSSTFSESLDVSGDVVVDGTLDVSGGVAFGDRLDVSGDVVVDGSLDVSGTTTLKHNLDVSGDVVVDGNVGIGGDSSSEKLKVYGDVTITGNIIVDGSFNFNEIIQNTTTVNNTLVVSTQLDISNQGTGPALKVSQYGDGDTQDVALFNAGDEGDALKIDSSGNAFVYKDMDISGLLTATGGITGNVTGNLIGNITGSTTIGGDLTINGDSITLSETYNNLNIGTSYTLQNKLLIKNNQFLRFRRTGSPGIDSGIQFSDFDVHSFYQYANKGSLLFNYASGNPVDIGDYGTNVMKLTSDGGLEVGGSATIDGGLEVGEQLSMMSNGTYGINYDNLMHIIRNGNNGLSYSSWIGHQFFVNSSTAKSGIQALTINQSGFLGILNTNPSLPLTVGTFTGGGEIKGTRSYLGSTGVSTNDSGNVGSVPRSALFLGEVWSTSLFVSNSGTINFSDSRIKQNIYDLVDDECLQLLRLLKPKKYQYIDTFKRGSDYVYGFIAQEVKEVLPFAIKIDTYEIPNIYLKGNLSNNSIILDNPFTLEYDTSGNYFQTLVIYDVNDKEYKVEIVDISNQNITISGEIPNGEVFVYGQVVDNLHLLKKDAIWTIATSALQEVDRQLQQEKEKTAILQTQYSDLLSRIQALESATKGTTVAEPVMESVLEPVVEPVIESVTEPVMEHVEESPPPEEPATEPVAESATEESPPPEEPATEPVAESATEESPPPEEPATEPATEEPPPTTTS